MSLVPSEEEQDSGIELSPQRVSPDDQIQPHDDDASSDSASYEASENDLTMLQAAALLTADCLGTGLLALPQDIQVLGTIVGLGFLVLNLPINLYAGTILSNAALQIEAQSDQVQQDGLVVVRKKNKKAYASVQATEEQVAAAAAAQAGPDAAAGEGPMDNETKDDSVEQQTNENHIYNDAPEATHDYIGMTQAAFHSQHGTYIATATYMVMGIYYTNIFLVLGDYILVMSHAVAAMIGEDKICLPTAGIVASTLMFGFSQLRTMSHLGHSVTFLSLACLAVVVLQCLIAGERNDADETVDPNDTTALRKMSALASIGFATGANKLLLNIRHEMKHREQAPYTLATSLTVFGSVYVGICLLAGPNPPSFLFNSIPSGPHRRIAGLLLWIHVAVSYAINSQAICSSMDRLFFHRISLYNLQHHPKRRWLLLTSVLTVSSYLVANIVPFFKDLVALIGALTAVPLTMLLPAILHRKVCHMPLWCPTRNSLASFGLMVFGLIFLVIGLVGALGSIEVDWTHNAPPFACSV